MTITFLIVRLMPGDPTTALISDSLSPEDALVLKESFGLDKPLYQQYFLFIRNLLKGDLGYSFFYKDSVASIIGNKLWWTLLLMGSSLFTDPSHRDSWGDLGQASGQTAGSAITVRW